VTLLPVVGAQGRADQSLVSRMNSKGAPRVWARSFAHVLTTITITTIGITRGIIGGIGIYLQ